MAKRDRDHGRAQPDPLRRVRVVAEDLERLAPGDVVTQPLS